MIKIQQNITLKNKTSYKIGGSAQFYVKIKIKEDVQESLIWASKNNQPIFILGKGTNILVSDLGWDGLVIDMSDYSSIDWDGTHAKCQSGALLNTLVKESIELGYSSMDKLAGIPGSVGGGLIMNAGAYGQNISNCLESVCVIDYSNFNIIDLKKKEIEFNYRTSTLKTKSYIIINASFNFMLGNKNEIKKNYLKIIESRNKKQPLNLPSCGSVFKRPKGKYAGKLIEQCGLKGHCIGGATVSHKHANFIVNKSGAKASDIRQLIKFIQEYVYKDKKVLLEPEVIFVGNFDVPLFRPE